MWEYDGYGNISRFTDTTPGSTVRTNYVYDSIGRISSFLRNDGFGGEIGYDSFNRVTGAWYKNIDGSRGTSYTYDSKTGLVSSLETDGLRVNNTYDGLNRISQKSYGFKNVTAENYVEKFTYRREGNRTDSQVTSHTFGSVTTRYEYDSAGNITAVRDNSGNLLNSYEYDELDRLTAEKDARTGKWYEYRYNSAGDMDLVTVYNCTVDAVSKEFVKGAEEYKNRFYFTNGNWENQCTTVILNGSTSNLTYDAIGNPLSYRDGMTMTWQNGRQLKSIVKGDTTLEFTYDINGQRQSKVEKKNGTTVHTTKYYYDGTKLAAENKDGTIVWYDYDENGVPIGMRVNGQDYIFRRNLQGDIVKIFNSDNDPVVGYNYQNAWGGGVEVTGPLGGSIGKYNSLRYRGYYYDAEFGLYYLNSRYYDPAMCRFINADGYVSTGQGNAGLNMYSYCGNNPVNRIDSNGRFFEKIGQCLKKAWNGIKTFFKNTFGAGSSTEHQIQEYESENFSGPTSCFVSLKTGEKTTKIVSKHGNSSKPISVYGKARSDNILLSSAGIKINFSEFTFSVNLGLDNTSVELKSRNGENESYTAIKADFSQIKVGVETGDIVWWDENKSSTIYTNTSITGAGIIAIYASISTGQMLFLESAKN